MDPYSSNTGVLIRRLERRSIRWSHVRMVAELRWCSHKPGDLWVRLPSTPGPWEGVKHIFPQSFQEDFADALSLDYQPLDLWVNSFLLFWAILFMLLCYGSPSKLIQREAGLWIRRPGLNSCYHSLPLWPWTNHFSSPEPQFFELQNGEMQVSPLL